MIIISSYTDSIVPDSFCLNIVWSKAVLGNCISIDHYLYWLSLCLIQIIELHGLLQSRPEGVADIIYICVYDFNLVQNPSDSCHFIFNNTFLLSSHLSSIPENKKVWSTRKSPEMLCFAQRSSYCTCDALVSYALPTSGQPGS